MEDGTHKEKKTGDPMKEDMLVNVEVHNLTVTFTLH
jgi:hypothetical protein